MIGFIGEEVVVDGTRLPRGTASLIGFARDLRDRGIEKITMTRGLARAEVGHLIAAFTDRASPIPLPERLVARGVRNVTLGRIVVDEVSDDQAGIAAAQRVYGAAVETAEQLWNAAKAGDQPDPGAARKIIDGLARLVTQDRTSLMALTALKKYDNYTFTHMVNVSVLTMAQARSLRIEGALLRQFGLGGLMHDIGKSRTPAELLTSPHRLTESEFAVMRKHPVDGAEMLRRHLELPPLAAVVAFEHHLRADDTGYPAGVSRPSLNLATQLCSIADVYDAMRSKRSYQRAFPTDRIIAVLQQNDGMCFDRNLVRRFGQLMGIYPVGNLVRLDTGALAVVLQIHSPDPSRPAVRVIVGPDGQRLAKPQDLTLWADDDPSGPPPRIVTPVDPADVGIDPLPFLDTDA